MKKVWFLVLALLIGKATLICSLETLTLSQFITRALSNPQNLDIIKIEEAFRTAKQTYATYIGSFGVGLSLTQTLTNAGTISGTQPVQTGLTGQTSLSGSKTVPFLFGNALNASLSHSFSPQSGLPPVPNQGNSTLSLQYTLPITPDSAAYSEYVFRVQDRAYEVAILNYVSSYESYIRGLIDAYVNFINLQAQFESAKSRFDDQKKLMRLTEARYELGDISGIEFVKAKVTRMQEESAFSNTEIQIASANIQLHQVLNIPQDTPIVLSNTLDFDVSVEKPEFYLSRIRYNKVYQTSARSLKDAQMSYLKSQVDLYPINQVTLQAGETFSTANVGSYTATMAFTVPIFDKGVRDIQFKNSKESLENSQKSFEDQVRKIRDDIISKYNQIIQFREQVAISQLFYDAARREYEVSYEQFNNGTASVQDIINSITNVQNSIQQIYATKRSLLLAVYDLKVAAGLFIPTEQLVPIW